MYGIGLAPSIILDLSNFMSIYFIEQLKIMQRRDIVEQIPSFTSNHANYNGPAGCKFRLQLVGPVAAKHYKVIKGKEGMLSLHFLFSHVSNSSCCLLMS
jgi:hypothetical protein